VSALKSLLRLMISLAEQRIHQLLEFRRVPEASLSKAIQADPSRFIKNVCRQVLLRDLPSLYGIQDIRNLNYLFTTLAYNTAGEGFA